jgi:hypothetical protein
MVLIDMGVLFAGLPAAIAVRPSALLRVRTLAEAPDCGNHAAEMAG